MPFPFTMRHFQVFGDVSQNMKDSELMSPESWDVLRKEHPFFSISQERNEWVATSEIFVKKDGQEELLKERARQIVELLRQKHINRIFSVGVGGAALEYQIKKMAPEIEIICSDYSPHTVETLQKNFTESEGVILFDILKDDWKLVKEKYIGDNGICIMYRVDASFSDQEWERICGNLAASGINKVLIIPTGMLTMMSIYNRKKRELLWFLRGIHVVFSGYIRTKERFREFWAPWYDGKDLVLGGLKSFLLTRR